MKSNLTKLKTSYVVLVITTLFAVFFSFNAKSSTAFAAELADVSGNFAEPEIRMLVAKGIVNGDGKNFFPQKAVTRAEFVKMLVVALGYGQDAEEIKNYPGPFEDADGHWASGYITTAWELGIARGQGARFYPDRSLNRAEMVAMIYRAFFPGESGGDQDTYPLLERFKDVDRIPSWARSHIARAVDNGVVTGTPEGLFEPARPATRAEAAKILAQVAARQGYIYDFFGRAAIEGDDIKSIKIEINGKTEEFALSGDVAAFRGRTRVSVKEMAGIPVYIILDGSRRVSYIRSST
ncbi:S-layer homology domain-containing protein [Thermoanaerobacterium sp. DL9XJH110]|uniref:S-layer homology domain-containing protein n=1 Tax=Thermoanaerobacterium sp. DL9XJH110 TaxID=3386643 RepID=UPI003BB4B967